MKILCVAEKPSIARSVAEILSSGNGVQNRQGVDQFCRNYDFTYRMPGTHANATALGLRVQPGEWIDITMTSVRGHVMHQDFSEEYQKWRQVDPLALFTAPIVSRVSDDAKKVARNLKAEVRHADLLMIWTDCDREGEHIGSEIVSVCRETKRNILVKRARFSAIIASQIHQAVQNPVDLDLRAAAAVESRIELDLRIGSAFTRLQTMFLQDRFREHLEKRVISYGPCQFPTLGFVVDQYYKVMEFVPEPFWYIAVNHKRDGVDVDFRWARNHLFVEQEVTLIYERCRQNPRATVKKVDSKQVRKFKPQPLTTVELQKAGGRLLRMAPKRILDVAEKLYQRGLLSYPRTETDQYDPAFDFKSYIQKQTSHREWGQFATRLADNSAVAFEKPINGRKNDKAHPPIHPTKPGEDLIGDEKRVYEYVTRRFLASCSKHAIGRQTTITLVIADEVFTASGIVVVERNYLEVFQYDSWGGVALPAFQEGETFIPAKIEKKQGETSRPKLLTEADLVSLMDRNGIGTDATIAEHIAKIIEREYVMVMAEGQTKYLVPSTLGMGLADGYNGIELAGEKSLCKPLLRRETEERMAMICSGGRTKQDTITQSLNEYNDVFNRVKQHTQTLANSVARYLLGEAAADGTRASGRPNGQVHASSSGAGDGPDSGPPPPASRGAARTSPLGTRSNGITANANGSRATQVDLSDDDEFGEIPVIDVDEDEITSVRPSSSPANKKQRILHPRPIAQQTRAAQSLPRAVSPAASPADQPMCRCSLPAAKRTVQKEGRNQGRTFWSCPKPLSEDTSCGFFEWADGNSHRSASSPQASSRIAMNGSERARQTPVEIDDEADVRRCHCDLRAQRIEATQPGPNQGRAFFKCPNISKVAQCKFFEWEDEERGQGGRASSGARDSSAMACFTCGETGHWSSDCPQKATTSTSGSRVTASTIRGSKRAAAAAAAPESRADGAKRGKCYKCGGTGHWANECTEADSGSRGSSSRAGSSSSRRAPLRGRGKRRRP